MLASGSGEEEGHSGNYQHDTDYSDDLIHKEEGLREDQNAERDSEDAQNKTYYPGGRSRLFCFN